MNILDSTSPIQLFLRSSLLSTVAATLTLVGIWVARNPVGEIGMILSIILIPLLLLYGGMLPVNLLLLLLGTLIRRFIPRLGESPLLVTVILALAGAGAGVGVVALGLGTLGLESEFFQVVILGAAVGGIVAGWIMTGTTRRRTA